MDFAEGIPNIDWEVIVAVWLCIKRAPLLVLYYPVNLQLESGGLKNENLFF